LTDNLYILSFENSHFQGAAGETRGWAMPTPSTRRESRTTAKRRGQVAKMEGEERQGYETVNLTLISLSVSPLRSKWHN